MHMLLIPLLITTSTPRSTSSCTPALREWPASGEASSQRLAALANRVCVAKVAAMRSFYLEHANATGQPCVNAQGRAWLANCSEVVDPLTDWRNYAEHPYAFNGQKTLGRLMANLKRQYVPSSCNFLASRAPHPRSCTREPAVSECRCELHACTCSQSGHCMHAFHAWQVPVAAQLHRHRGQYRPFHRGDCRPVGRRLHRLPIGSIAAARGFNRTIWSQFRRAHESTQHATALCAIRVSQSLPRSRSRLRRAGAGALQGARRVGTALVAVCEPQGGPWAERGDGACDDCRRVSGAAPSPRAHRRPRRPQD